MADDVRITTPGPNGNGGVQVDLQQKRIGIWGKDAVTLLFIVIIGAGLWLRSKDISQDLRDISGHIQALYARQEQLSMQILQQNTLIETKGQLYSEKLHDQSTQLMNEMHAQTQELNTNSARVEGQIERGMEKLWTALVTLNENLRREPGAQLPLGIPPPREASPGGPR